MVNFVKTYYSDWISINLDGSKNWFRNGRRHREDGPAIEYSDGVKQYWYEGELYENISSNEEWKELIKLKSLW